MSRMSPGPFSSTSTVSDFHSPELARADTVYFPGARLHDRFVRDHMW